MRRFLILFLWICSSVFTAHMQNPPGWPPKAVDIFAPGIAVLDSKAPDAAQPNPSGKITLAPQRRAVKGADGRIYDWPESVNYFRFTEDDPIIIDNILYLYSTSSPQGEVDATWALNLKTGVFAQYLADDAPDTPCGKIWPKHMGWDLYHANNQTYLCNQTTSQRVAFPQGYDLATTAARQPFALDLPDKRLLFVGKSLQNNQYTFFVHDPTTDTLAIAGTIPFETGIGYVVESADCILIWTYDLKSDRLDEGFQYSVFHPSKTAITLYEPRVKHPDVVLEWDFWPNLNFTVVRKSANNLCTVTLYDLVTDQKRIFDFGDLCDPDYTDTEGTSYYREISADQKTATVIQFNPITGKRQELYTGEVEDVQWASKDARYLMLIIGDSGQIDSIPGTSFGPNSSWVDGTLELIDVPYKLTRFKTDAYINNLNFAWSPYVYEIAPNWLSIRYYGYDKDNKSLLMHLSPDGIQIREIKINFRINDEWATYSDDSVFGLYHIEDNRRVPIFKSPSLNYRINSLVPLGDNRFEVDVMADRAWGGPSDQYEMLFTIQVPGIDLPVKQNILQYALTGDEGIY